MLNLILCIILLYTSSCYGNDTFSPNIVILHTNYTDVLASKIALSLEYQSIPQENIQKINLSNNKEQNYCSKPSLVIAISNRGLKHALINDCDSPILATSMYRHSYKTLVSEYKFKNNRKITSLFIEQPIEKQLNLIKSIAYHTNITPVIGILIGPKSNSQKNEIIRESNKQDLKVRIIKLNENQHPIIPLKNLLKVCNILLTIPDPQVFNNKTTHGILLTAYKHNVPIIGYSKSYVNVGGLASIYSSKSQHARDTAELALKLIHDPQMFKKNYYPTRYSVVINYIAAHTLGLKIKNTEIIKHYLEKFDKARQIS